MIKAELAFPSAKPKSRFVKVLSGLAPWLNIRIVPHLFSNFNRLPGRLARVPQHEDADGAGEIGRGRIGGARGVDGGDQGGDGGGALLCDLVKRVPEGGFEGDAGAMAGDADRVLGKSGR